MPLGFDPLPALQSAMEADRSFARTMTSGLEQLGKDVRGAIRQVQTNRELRAFGEEAAQIAVDSPTFTQDILGAMMRHPLALEDKRGVAAIELLGNANKQWQRQQELQMQLNAEQNRPLAQRPFQQVPGLPGMRFDPNTGEVGGTPLPTPNQQATQERNRQRILSDLDRRRIKAIDDAYKLDAEARKIEAMQADKSLSEAQRAQVASDAKMARENARRKSEEANQIHAEWEAFRSATPAPHGQAVGMDALFDVTEVVPGASVQPQSAAPLPQVPAAVFPSAPASTPPPKRLIWNPKTGNFD